MTPKQFVRTIPNLPISIRTLTIQLPHGEALIYNTPQALKHIKGEASRWRYGLRVDGSGENERFTPQSERPPKQFCLEWGTREAAETAAAQLADVRAAITITEYKPHISSVHLIKAREEAQKFLNLARSAWYHSGTGNELTLIDFFTRRAVQAAAMAE